MSPGLPQSFGRYRFSFSVQAEERAVEPASGSDPEGGRLVSSGSFRVDVWRMLERLKDRQFSDARDALLPLARAAAASGASALELVSKLAGLDLRFDGRPFSAAQLDDPFRCLFEGDDPEAVRSRQLAYGLLALARLGVSAVQATSGGPTGQASLVLAEPGYDPAPIPINRGEGTLLRVRWAGWRSWWSGREAIERLERAYGFSSLSVKLGKRRLPISPVRADEGWFAFAAPGWQGAFRFLDEDRPSVLRLFWLGTYIETVERELKGQPPVEAILAGEDLSLDLSQARVVRDSRLEAGVEVLASHVGRRHGPASKKASYDYEA